MITLRSMIAHLATMIRYAGIAYILVQVAIWHSFYAESPWRAAAPALAVAWATAAALEQEALPLLRGIADGTLDPADESVREQCAMHAAVLRRALTEGTPGGGLPAALAGTLRAAAARGQPVTVQAIGDPGTPRPPVAAAVRAAVDAVLSALTPEPVTLTALATGGDIELYLTFSGPVGAVPDLTRLGRDVPAAAHWNASLSTTETGEGFLEISWRKDGAA